MPAGNLTVVHNLSGTVIATGCQTSKQVEACILDHMKTLATEETSEEISSSYSVYTPYKKFGDAGVKGYSIPRSELVTEISETIVEEDVQTQEDVQPTDDQLDQTEAKEEDLDFV